MYTARLALVPLLFLVGCSDSADPTDGGEKVVDSPVGTWIIDWNDERTKEFVERSKKSSGNGTGFKATAVEKWLPKTNWVFKDDGTFVCEDWQGALSHPSWEPTKFTGKWTQDGNQIEVVPDKGKLILELGLEIKDGKLHFRVTNPKFNVNIHWTFSRKP